MKTWRYLLLSIVVIAAVGCADMDNPIGLLDPSSPTPTASPTATWTPTATPTSTPTPLPTPTPTPAPAEVLAAGDHAYRNGDWTLAEGAYRRLVEGPVTSEDQRIEATLGLAQTYLAQAAYDGAIPLLEAVLTTALPDEARADVHVLLGDALRGADLPLRAADHYSAALGLRPILALPAHEWRGDMLYQAGALAEAEVAYGLALAVAETASDRVGLWEKIGLTRSLQGDGQGALDAYDTILAIAQIPGYRARIMYLAAETALVHGETQAAYARMLDLVSAYPSESEAYEALVTLVEAGVPVDEMVRGMVDYYAEAYTPAINAFYRVIMGDPDHDGAPHYYAGLSYLALDRYRDAQNEFDLILDTHPDDAYVPVAWIGKGDALAALGQWEAALAAYRTVADTYPHHARAPEALWEAADLLVDTGDARQAAEILVELADRYPDDEGAPEARFRAGLLRYRDGDPEGAQTAWRDLTTWYPSDARAQAAWFWLGKTYLGAGATLSATEALSAAVSLGPWDFYGLRAADLTQARAPFAPPTMLDTSCTSGAAQDEAETWLRSWLNLAPDAPVSALTTTLKSDLRLQRGSLLLRLGHFDEGKADLETLRVAFVGDPLAQYQLALYFRDVGLYRSSIIAASALWRLSPAGDLPELPAFIGCLAYPMYYRDLVEREAATQDLNALFVYALLRQESLFEGYATSFAAAHGLMQVIPPTGAYIAQQLAWPPDYETQDLYRPMVSVRFGTWYLAEQRDLLEGNLFGAMAAYNGGPGNSLRWWEIAGEDPDLFVESIGFRETRTYVRVIREHYARYRWLYGGRGE